MAISATTVGIVATVLLLVYQLSRIGQRPKGYPPGPPTLPLIGNLHQMPNKKGHLQFQKWAEEYGPIYSLILGTQVMISSRPEMYLGNIVSGGLRMLLMEYSETWRMLRKILHTSLNIKAARTYVPYQDLENKAMLLAVLEQPALFIDHIRRYANSLTTQMLFGFRTLSIDDPRFKQLFHGFEKFSQVTGSQSAALLNIFPILRYLPDALVPMRKYSKELHRKEYDLYVGYYLETKKRLQEGKAKPCFCVDLVRAQDELGFSDGIAGYVSGSLLEAGSDTTSATLIGFVQAMLLFPEVPKAAQAELDRVCGDRLPDLNDLPDLPYIRGCMKESMRWMPTAILGVPHAVIRDDDYMGYKIPKGAAVMWNVWAISNDPKRHADPRRFDPSRWAHDSQTSAEAAMNSDASKRDHFLFGAGRRLCQGMHIADRSLFLAMSRMLWAFDFEKAVDEGTGQEIVPDMEELVPENGLLVQPKPFQANIKPRSEWKANQVREEWHKMRKLLDNDMQWETVPEGLIWRDYEPVETPEKV
ncbi:cytochrome P450 [Hypoxylon cercidicola]|nr:cytochrome P450 [Hypoxylon cercidicola]